MSSRSSCCPFRLGFWDGLPSSAPIIQAEFGSSVLALFSYIVPDVLRVACQMSSVVLSKYLQSVVVCCLGCQMSFNCAVRAPSSSVTKCFQCTVRVPSVRLGKSLSLFLTATSLLMYCQVPSICLGSHFILLCQVSFGIFVFCFFQ